MRCVGAENPPCQRCARVDRRCIVRYSRRSRAVEDDHEPAESQSPNCPNSAENEATARTRLSRQSIEVLPTQAREQATFEGTPDSPRCHDQQSCATDRIDAATEETGSCKHPFTLPSVYLTSPLSTLATQLGTIPARDDSSTATVPDKSTTVIRCSTKPQSVNLLDLAPSRQSLVALIQL